MRLPKTLEKAVIIGPKVYFKKNMSDKELVELMQWRYRNGVEGGITAKVLVKMYSRSIFCKEIKELFKKSNQIDMLLDALIE